MTRRFLATAGKRYPLAPRGPFTSRAHVFDQADIDALHAAVGANRPLLIRGEPGTGKTQIAEAAAAVLQCPLVTKTVDGRTEARDLLYEVDFVLRLAEAQLRGVLNAGANLKPEQHRAQLEDELHLRHFTRPGPLWWAFDWEGAAAHQLARPPKQPANGGWKAGAGVVVLIDEIDKAEPDVPNGLLEALGEGKFQDPLGNEVEAKDEAPLIIITTNEERELPDAFVRRCFVHTLSVPDDEAGFVALAQARGGAHFPKLPADLLAEAAKQLFADRQACDGGGPRPGLAEYLDMLRLLASGEPDLDQLRAALARARHFVFRKHLQKPERASAPPSSS